MSFGIHLSCEVCPFRVEHVFAVGQQCHCLYGECEYGLRALLVGPFHEALLQPAESVPVGLASVREVEFAEKAFEVWFVVIGYVPEYRLVVSGSRRLVDGVYYLLEAVCDDFVDGTLF